MLIICTVPDSSAISFNISKSFIISPCIYTIFLLIWYIIYNFIIFNYYPPYYKILFMIQLQHINNIIYIIYILLLVIYYIKYNNIFILYDMYKTKYNLQVPNIYMKSLQNLFKKNTINYFEFHSPLFQYIFEINNNTEFDLISDLNNFHRYTSQYIITYHYLYILLEIILLLISLLILYLNVKLRIAIFILLISGHILWQILKSYINSYIHKLYLENKLYKAIYNMFYYYNTIDHIKNNII